MTAFFITGTGTDIGKTYVTANLVRYFHRAGCAVSALKPVASGFSVEAISSSDPGLLLEAQKLPLSMLDRISPWRFAAPLSPDMAAAREGRSIDFAQLVAMCRHATQRCEGVTLIEGVGGVMVPLDETHTVRDWMVALGHPVVLVTGTYLGTISHTLTALEVLRHAGLEVAVVVINESQVSSVSAEETAASVRRFSNVPSVLIPRRQTGLAHQNDVAGLAALLAA